MKLKEIVISKYSSVNNFVDQNYLRMKEIGLGRTQVYNLLNHSLANPGVLTLAKLATLLNIPVNVVVDEYIEGGK